MNLVESPELDRDVIATAEALIAAILIMPDLSTRTMTETGTVGPSGHIALRYPVTGAITVEIDEKLVTATLSDHSRTLDVSRHIHMSYGAPWGAGYRHPPYTARYTTGWTAETLPTNIRAAVTMTAQMLTLWPERDGVRSERVGDVSRAYYQYEDGGVPASVLKLLQHWMPLLV